jgi:hypothetical protein
VGPYPAGLRFLAAQVAGIAYHDDQPRRHGLRLRATFSAARWVLAHPQPVAALSERRRQQCSLGPNE